jgi:mono/diheme cytochrome c family protein
VRILVALTLLSFACTAPAPPPIGTRTGALAPDTEEALAEGLELYVNGRAEALLWATDPFERFERIVGPGVVRALAEAGNWPLLFVFGDETFEAELDRRLGIGQGPQGPPGTPARPQRVHTGELGGNDATSCRACHFSGGPDGAGTATQVALLRGDGNRLSSTIRRDAPHVMGLGWISLLARQIEFELAQQVELAQGFAEQLGEPRRIELRVQGMDFGAITARVDGSLDTSELRHISSDLVVRPFGHKGRHADLVALCDEAIQIHHGLQSDARIDRFADEPGTWLGPGDVFDPDADGVQAEATSGQAVLLAGYLSMLPTPQLRPPADPNMALAWARGRRVFETVGCARCHVPSLRLFRTDLTLTARGGQPLSITIPMHEAALDPRPRNLDFSPGPDGIVPGGIPVFAYTDLRRHDLGPELADPRAERLPDDVAPVPGAVWLTRSLWGLADTAPYLHDGRAQTVDAAIEWHGGEAADVRAAWRALPDAARAELRLFLLSLTREPVVLVE